MDNILDQVLRWARDADALAAGKWHRLGGEMHQEAAAEVERLRLFERYANKYVEEQVADAIAFKATHGKYPFED